MSAKGGVAKSVSVVLGVVEIWGRRLGVWGWVASLSDPLRKCKPTRSGDFSFCVCFFFKILFIYF